MKKLINKTEKVTIRMQSGEAGFFNHRGDVPEIHLNEGGKSGTYLWVGQSASPGGCYATLSGAKTLEKLAMGILRSLGHDVKLS